MKNIEINLMPASGTDVFKGVVKNNGFYEPEIVDFLVQHYLSAGTSLFVNVGSNIGLFPLLCATLNRVMETQIDIYAHEPLPYLQDIAKKLKAMNDADYALSDVALSDSLGEADFYVSARSDSSNSLIKGFRQEKEVIKVRVDTVDNLYIEKFRSHKGNAPVLMVDVETAEPHVLRGAEKVMKECRPVVVCEVLAGRTEKALSEILKEVGYVPYRYNGESWAKEKDLVGDAKYIHRDWLFFPLEKSLALGDRFRIKKESPVRFLT